MALSSVVDGQVKPVDDELSKSILENNKCFLLDCGSEIFVWVGRVTQVDERKTAIQAAEVQVLHFFFFCSLDDANSYSFLALSGVCCWPK